MSDWQPLKIGDLGRVVTGKTPPTESAEYYDGDELFVSPKDLTWNSYYVDSTATRISEKALDKFKGQVIPRDTVMFTSLSFAFGKMGIASRSCITNQQINSIIVNDRHCARFVYYLLRAYEPYIFAYNSGIDTPIVPKSVFERIPVLVPCKTAQEKIASLLSAYDDLIANNQRRIGLLESMAEEIYREWFVRMRCPVDAEANRSPQRLRPFDSLCQLQRGFDLPDSDMQPGTVPVIASTSIKGFHNVAKVKPPVITTGRSGSLGIVLYVREPAWPLNTSLWVKDFKGNSPNLVYFTLRGLHLENFNAGAGVPTLNRNHLKSIKVRIPTVDSQDRFDKLIEPILAQVQTLRLACAKLVSTRDALLPRLISGKLRVDALDIQFPPSMPPPAESVQHEAIAR